MSMQIKRGSTDGWSLGPELIDFGTLGVNGKDSTIHCEGNVVEMYVGTVSAERFPEDAESKRPGLWLISPGEFDTSLGDSLVKLTMSVESDAEELPGCELAVWINDIKYSKIPTPPFGRGSFMVESNYDTNIRVKMAMLWEEDTPKSKIKVTFSIRKSDEGESLLPGQLGAEYLDGGGTVLKVGPTGEESTNWKDIPYLGQILPPCMYGTDADMKAIQNPVQGQLFYKKVT